MNKHHQKILFEIKKHKGKGTAHSSNDSYISSGHLYYDVSVPIRRSVAKDWLKSNKNITQKEFFSLLDSLFSRGKSHEEKTIASILLGYHKEFRKQVTPAQLNSWLRHLVGWAEIDSLCQNNFDAEEFLGDWGKWESFITKLSKDKNINKRRAALVLLTGPVHYSKDKKLRDLAFKVIDTLKSEKEIIITKAISWLLREMVTLHRKEVSVFIEKNRDSLPKVAIRETKRKISTGRK